MSEEIILTKQDSWLLSLKCRSVTMASLPSFERRTLVDRTKALLVLFSKRTGLNSAKPSLSEYIVLRVEEGDGSLG